MIETPFDPFPPHNDLLEEAVLEFCAELDKATKECADKGWLAKPKAPHVFSAETDAAYAEWDKK